MNSQSDTPEITTDCWDILNTDPKNMMCSNSRMIVKRREDSKTHIVSCTLIPFAKDFSYGNNLKKSFNKIYLKCKMLQFDGKMNLWGALHFVSNHDIAI